LKKKNGMKSETNVTFLLGNVLSLSAKAIPAFAIFAYFSGWLYLNEYFSEFGINRSSYGFSDYTTFLYLSSVIAKILEMLIDLNLEVYKAILAVLIMVSGPILSKKLPKFMPRMLILRVWVWFWLSVALSFVSIEAGRVDAQKVFNKDAQSVKVYLTKSFKEEIAASYGNEYAEVRISEILEANEKGALALIWRNANEIILLMYGVSGQFHGKPLEILRINNRFIVCVITNVDDPTKSRKN